MTALLKYDAACQAIAEAKSVDEVSDWIDKAAAVREYTRRIGNRQLELDAIEIRVRAKRRRGELLLDLKEQGRFKDGKPSSSDDGLERLTLADLGVTPNESSEEQKIAKIEGNAFERLLARCRAHAEAEKRHSFDVLKPPPSAPTAHGAGRVTPPDDLDYAPTPPWATRALFEHVLPAIGTEKIVSAWEPCCGEGHMAEVISEYVPHVYASDIFDHGYGDVHDYLAEPFSVPREELNGVGWTIFNSPFDGEKPAPPRATMFVERALRTSGKGVAAFMQLRYLEGVGRFNRIWRDWPPTIVAPFVERVPLHMGRWEPQGGTLTAYMWVVWAFGCERKPMFWIPPGQRDALSKPDDAERFTQRPVQKRVTLEVTPEFETPHDPATGEVIEDDGLELPACLRRTPQPQAAE